MLLKGLNNLASLELLQKLADRCEKADGYSTKLYWNNLRERFLDGQELDYLYFFGKKLVGHLSVFLFTEGIEITSIVDPRFRKRGFFKSLLQASLRDLYAYPFIECKLITNANATSWNNKLKQDGGQFDHAELEMRAPAVISKAVKHQLEFFQATEADIDLICELHAQSFPATSANLLKQRLNVTLYEPNRRIFIAKTPEGKAVGKLHIREEYKYIYIHDLGVINELHGQGYGQSLLVQWHQIWHKTYSKPIVIEVLAHNEPAVRLYQSCGFILQNTYHFWRFDINELFNKMR